MENDELAGQVSYLIKEGQLKAAVGVLTEAIEDAEGRASYIGVMKAYHTHLPMLTKIRGMTDMRKKHVKAREIEHKTDDTFWPKYFSRVAKSDFLTGRKTNARHWRATFDWLILPTNMVKVLEGNYDNTSTNFFSESDRLAARLSA